MYSKKCLNCGYTTISSRLRKDIFIPTDHIKNYSSASIKMNLLKERNHPPIIDYNNLKKKLDEETKHPYITHLIKDKQETLKRIEREKTILGLEKILKVFMKENYRYKDLSNLEISPAIRNRMEKMYNSQRDKMRKPKFKVFINCDNDFNKNKTKCFNSSGIPNTNNVDSKAKYKIMKVNSQEPPLNEVIVFESNKKSTKTSLGIIRKLKPHKK
ncbi:MAG: hypothetical protein MJ252_05820 [archaeon]|nr:hypothetical protein [archaeon]